MKRTFALLILTSAIGVLRAEEQSSSPYATAADFAKYAMKLREQALLKVEPQVFVPTSSRPAVQRFAWKTNIVTTVFWIGEQAGGNNPVPNNRSSWDLNWTSSYGGFDCPDKSHRPHLNPIRFTSEQKPLYLRFPHNPRNPR